MKKVIALVLLFAGNFCCATVTVSGTLKDLSGSPVTSRAKVVAYLRGCGGNQPRSQGGTPAVIIPPSFEFIPNASGILSGTLYSNATEVECGGQVGVTWYGFVTVRDGKPGPEVAYTVSGTSFNLDSATPNTTSPVVAAPTGDSTYLRRDGGNQMSGSIVGTATGLSIGSSAQYWNLFGNIGRFTKVAAPTCLTDYGFFWYDSTANAFRLCENGGSAIGLGAHALLSATHSDTTAAAVQRGDIITGQAASPLWKRLAKGASGTYLRSDGTDVGYSAIIHADLPAVDRTRQIVFIVGADNGSALADTDDQPTFFVNRLGNGITITEVWCESDAGTPSINLQHDDGTPANILSSNLSCSTSGASTTTFSGSEASIANTDKLDFVMVSAGGTAKRVTLSVKYTVD